MKLSIEIDLNHRTFNDAGYLNTDELQKVLEKIRSSLAALPLNKIGDRSGTIVHADGTTIMEWVVL